MPKVLVSVSLLQSKAPFLRWMGALFLAVFIQCVFLSAISGTAYAQKVETQEVKTVKEADLSLDQARNSLKEIQKTLIEPVHTFNEKQLNELRDRLNKLQTQASAVDTALSPALESSKARLAELGQIDPEVPEAKDLKKQRDALTQEVATIDGQLKIARLISVEVKQSLGDLGAIRKQQFQAVLSHRYLSPLSPESWHQVREGMEPDLRAAQQVFHEIKDSVEHVPLKTKWLLTGLAVLWAYALFYIWKRFIRFLLKRTQSTRLRRTLLATCLVGLYVLFPVGITVILLSILTSAEGLSDELTLFIQKFIGIVTMSAFIAGLGRALLAPNKPTWRLPKLPNEVARALAWLPLALGVFITIMWSIQKVTGLVNSSLTTLLFVNSVFALGLNAIVGLALWRAERYYRVAGRLELSTPLASSLHSLALKVVAIAVVSSLVAWMFGYIALSNFIIQEVVWLGTVIFSAYLLLCFLDDVIEAILNSFNQEVDAQRITGRQLRTRGQFVLLLAGFLKIALVLIMLLLIFLPFGEDPSVWLQRRLVFLLQGFSFGQVTVKPTVFLYAFLVLIGSVLVVQHLQNWLENKYLPYTGLEQSMSASTARLVSYVGYMMAGVLALSTAGIDFESLAWIVSALSVGIGFGLQAVVQNFVSGLLLLAERPIKVGDWITIGTDVEGNVRQINARATEIEMFDRSTVIVPNSELITKTVRNVTLSDPLGRGHITVIMPVDVSAELVRQCLFDAVESTEEVLTDPEPAVIIDGFMSGGIAYSLFIFLSSPRLVRAARSEVFFKILANFEKNNISLHPTQRMEVVEQSHIMMNNEKTEE